MESRGGAGIRVPRKEPAAPEERKPSSSCPCPTLEGEATAHPQGPSRTQTQTPLPLCWCLEQLQAPTRGLACADVSVALLPDTVPCRAGSALPAWTAVTVRVLPAEVRQYPLYTVTPEGGSINITCSVHVNGTLLGVHLRQSHLLETRKVTYYDDENTPTVDERFQGRVVFSGTMDNLTITMQRLRPEDSGAYFCEAIAEDGQDWGNGTMLVVTGRQRARPRGHCPPCPSWAASPHSGSCFLQLQPAPSREPPGFRPHWGAPRRPAPAS